MRVVPALAFAFSFGAFAGCDRVGRSVLGAPEAVIPHDDGVSDAFDATTPIDVPTMPVDTVDVPVTCEAGQRNVNGACVMEGDLTFTLTWDRPCDLDLHVKTPALNEIYYGDRMQDDGTLDRDDMVGTGPENIYWPIAPSPGDYIVCVVPFELHDAGVVNFTVRVRRNGVMVAEWTGTRSESIGNVGCSVSAETYVDTYTEPSSIPDM